ncbi:S-layer homology domain-containing protein [Paenibacillus chitinolyticus]|uniref:S-layer homology domain-containing protein n=1 Tax=Paenibacillus chitinolyticus TaxID=79263 RepID=UPI003671B08C
MSNMSSRIPNHSQNPKDIQGGDKKVMKKSLSVILSTAMALSVFSSVAFAAKADDFTDLKDLDAATKAKFDEMIQAGIFDGVETNRFGLNDKMNRAQFAKVAALVFNLKSSATTSSFDDVKSSDPANGYALPYIEAIYNAKITDGYAEGKFNPAGDVTKEQLAAFLIRGLGKDAEAKAKPGVSDKTVSDWAKGYVQLAQELKLFETPAGQPFNGTSPATRDLLVTSSYAAKQQIVPDKVSVAEAKATGVQKVEVKLNGPVDTAKAKLELKKGSTVVATTTEWAADKKSAVLTLSDNVKIGEATYSVVLSGLEANAIDKASVEFQGVKEEIKSLEFVNASDTIAQSAKARVKLVAKNQYGEKSSLNSSGFTANTPGFDSNLTKDSDGFLVLTINTKNATGGSTPGVTIVPVYVYDNDSRVTVSKNFKLGVQPFVTKVELGDVKYASGKTALNSKGDTATISLTQYDQYGNPVAYDDTDAIVNVFTNVQPYVQEIKSEYGDFDNNNFGEVRVSLTGAVDKSGEYTINVYAGGSSATKKVSVNSAKVANKVEFGEYDDVIASRDTNKYIPVNAYDEQGNKLSVDDLVNDTNLARIRVSGSGVDVATKLVKSGEHKGKIQITSVTAPENATAVVTLSITEPGVNDYKTKQFKINKARVADALKIKDEAATKIYSEAGKTVESEFKFEVLDQYGKKLDQIKGGPVVENGKSVSYAVYFEADVVTAPENLSVTAKDARANLTVGGDGVRLTDFTAFNKGFKFVANGAPKGKISFTAKLQKNSGDGWKDASSNATRSIEAIDKNADLIYSVTEVKDLFAAKDSGLLTADQKQPTTSAVAKSIKVTAKDGAGDKVAIPENRIETVTSSTYEVAVADVANGKGYVLGNKAGTSKISVYYKDIKDNYKTLTYDVTVRNEAVKVDKMTAEETYTGAANKTYAYEYMDLKVVDQYGVEYKEAKISDYDNLLGVRYILEEATNDSNTPTGASVNSKTGQITVGSATKLTVRATAASGVSKTIYLTIE